MENLIIGNIISFIAAISLAISCVVKERNTVFFLQFLNCAILAVSSYFFSSYAAITTLVICCIRNIFIIKDRFTLPAMLFVIISVVIFGLLANNCGIIGLLPVFATVEYTLCSYFIKDIKKTRISILINESIWVIYSLLIMDISTTATDIFVITVDIISIVKHKSR